MIVTGCYSYLFICFVWVGFVVLVVYVGCGLFWVFIFGCDFLFDVCGNVLLVNCFFAGVGCYWFVFVILWC